MERHVQTELSEATYLRLRRRAQQESRPIEALVRDAVEAYVREGEPPDPLDAFIGSLPLGGDWSTRKGWRDPFRKQEQESRRG